MVELLALRIGIRLSQHVPKSALDSRTNDVTISGNKREINAESCLYP